LAKATTDTLTNKTYDTAGTGNSFKINGVAVTANQERARLYGILRRLSRRPLSALQRAPLLQPPADKIQRNGRIGYATGAGGAVTQLTSRTTGVQLDKTSGAITLFAAARRSVLGSPAP